MLFLIIADGILSNLDAVFLAYIIPALTFYILHNTKVLYYLFFAGLNVFDYSCLELLAWMILVIVFLMLFTYLDYLLIKYYLIV